MLDSPGDSYYGDKAYECAEQVDKGDFPPAQEDPYEVHHYGKAARPSGPVHQFTAERPEGICPQFEQLESERDADDGDAQQQACDVVYHGDYKTAQYEPQYIPKRFHLSGISLIDLTKR